MILELQLSVTVSNIFAIILHKSEFVVFSKCMCAHAFVYFFLVHVCMYFFMSVNLCVLHTHVCSLTHTRTKNDNEFIYLVYNFLNAFQRNR